ncbi:hypothetical protein N9Q97_00675 [Flavobacteriaceae bacterium]|nr:hypothetical protein [Flavobacteriaceae bacterium]
MNQDTITILVYIMMLIAGIYLIVIGIKEKNKSPEQRKKAKDGTQKYYENKKKKEIEHQKSMDKVIADDPILQKIDKEIGDLNQKADKYLKQDKEYMAMLKKHGIDIK